MTYCLFSCLTHFLNTFTPFFIPFVCSISEFELFQRMLHTNVWLKSPFYVRFVHLICKNQQEKPNAAGHPERPLDFPSKRSLNLHAPLRRLFADRWSIRSPFHNSPACCFNYPPVDTCAVVSLVAIILFLGQGSVLCSAWLIYLPPVICSILARVSKSIILIQWKSWI